MLGFGSLRIHRGETFRVETKENLVLLLLCVESLVLLCLMSQLLGWICKREEIFGTCLDRTEVIEL